MQISLNARLPWRVRHIPSGLLAECEALGLTLQGDDEAELKSLIAEGLHLLFLDLLEDGELDTFLRAKGWTLNHPVPPNYRDAGVVFTAPFDLVRELGARRRAR